MNLSRASILILVMVIGFGCNNKDSSTTSQLVTQKEAIKVKKDLSLLSPEEAIKTKFSKLQLACSYDITSVEENQGQVLSYTKSELHVWNILEETVLTKKLSIKDNYQNIFFNFASDLSLSLDSTFNVSITGMAGIENSTIFNRDNSTTIISGGNGNQFIINESEVLNVFDTSFGPSSRKEQSKISIDCSLISEVNADYK